MTPSRLLVGVLVAGCVVAGLACRPSPVSTAPEPAPPASPPAPAGPAPFAGWPTEPPALAFVLTGQTYGYLSPCGCSSPQKGGLERRHNLMAGLRARGWEVVGLDLGDMAATKGVGKQNLLKYRTAMQALGNMGYAAVGLGEHEFKAGLFDLLAEFTVNNPGKPPTVLAANLVGAASGGGGPVPRTQLFPGGADGKPMVEAVEVVARPGRPAVGVVAVVGPDAAEKATQADKQFGFLNNVPVLDAATQQLASHPANPQLRVLLYNGLLAQAKLAAEKYPQFQLVLCQSDDPEPPDFPTPANGGKTLLVQVGHKGQNVGVVGAFPSSAGGFTLKYQRVALTEDYLTPPGEEAEKANPALRLLQEYADAVKRIDSLKLARANPVPHPAQVQAPEADLTFVGSQACQACHPAEYAAFEKTSHSHAYKALSEIAKRPSGRQYDAECIVCHTVGFEHPGGYENAEATPHLKNVGCETCHGPGSGHSKYPADPKLLALLSPWKTAPSDRLPDLEAVKRMAALSPIERTRQPRNPAQIQVENRVDMLCRKCHDGDNDPHFDLWTYLPKVWHSGLTKK